MDSRLVIKQIKQLSNQIAANQISTEDARVQLSAIASDLSNPYLLCIPQLISTANAANIDTSVLTNKMALLKK